MSFFVIFKCPECGNIFIREIRNDIKKLHNGLSVKCKYCNRSFRAIYIKKGVILRNYLYISDNLRDARDYLLNLKNKYSI